MWLPGRIYKIINTIWYIKRLLQIVRIYPPIFKFPELFCVRCRHFFNATTFMNVFINRTEQFRNMLARNNRCTTSIRQMFYRIKKSAKRRNPATRPKCETALFPFWLIYLETIITQISLPIPQPVTQTFIICKKQLLL